ncbi:ubiquinone/menaquinone biosynthesis methyltransferase [Pendulispora rubella]|uniref:Demethylmenaquinone methyltransferase n=1 Tax=Pendulispora rubella TaxID=2741070 RepID=A0ABZ2KUI0_9BACT
MTSSHGATVRAMFDRIAPTYDVLNRLMSAGRDQLWRRKAVAALTERAPEGALLDLCAGTLDLTALLDRARPASRLVACDFAKDMLERGRHKAPRAETVVGDALDLPFGDGEFAGVVCGFGMRNLGDLARGVAQVRRVLAPGGVFVTLEFFRPERPVTRAFHAAYAEHVMPKVGGLLSGDKQAYSYLVRTMKNFATRAEYETELVRGGFSRVTSSDLTMGIASIVVGEVAL